MYTATEIAQMLGLMTPHGTPHANLIGTLLRVIKAQPAYIQNGSTKIYGPCVLPILRKTYGEAVHHELPEYVEFAGRIFNVRYWPEESGAINSSIAKKKVVCHVS